MCALRHGKVYLVRIWFETIEGRIGMSITNNVVIVGLVVEGHSHKKKLVQVYQVDW